MVSSQTSGELQLTSETITGPASTTSRPNTISAMRTASSARSGAVTGPMNGMSEWRIALAVMCRWRLGTGTSTGSQVTEPVLCSAGASQASLWNRCRSSRVP